MSGTPGGPADPGGESVSEGGDPAPDPLVGTELGDYRLERRLGAGGMGVVYSARDLVLDRRVALKVMVGHMLDDSVARARFQREIRHAATIEHPNVIPVYDAGYEQGHFFIAMRLIDGPDLGGVVRRGPLAIGRAAARFHELAMALQRVHRGGLVHRDVKPQNVLLADWGTPDEYALLGDFGISRALDTNTVLTSGLLGTAEYMAPEILRWQPAEPRSDQYSLACVLFEMIAGHGPYHDRDLPAAHLEAPIPNLTEVTGAPAETGAIVRRAMAKDPADRFADMREFAETVRRSLLGRPSGDASSGGKGPAGDGRDPAITSIEPPEATTLHAEIAAVLEQNGNGWMTTRELARAVNDRARYRRRDGSSVTGSQIHARTRNYAKLFERNGTRARLRIAGPDPEE